MGMFDTVLVPCPKCGAEVECQSKSGDCTLTRYPLAAAPANVLADVNRHAPHECQDCGHTFTVPLHPAPPAFLTAKGLQFYAKDSDGQWYYANHSGTWQTCPPPF
jgi:hypothetical protein